MIGSLIYEFDSEKKEEEFEKNINKEIDIQNLCNESRLRRISEFNKRYRRFRILELQNYATKSSYVKWRHISIY